MQIKFIYIFLLISNLILGQKLFEGPANGFTSGRVIVSTNQQTEFNSFSGKPFRVINHSKPTLVKSSLLKKNAKTNSLINFNNTGNIVVNKFQGLDDINAFIPPDPYIAAGPNHLVQVDNARFRITDKIGNDLGTYFSKNWFSGLVGEVNPFDPKIIFDHYNNRWLMVCLEVNYNTSESYFLISVSDDENPLGDWACWAVPSNVNGNTPSGEFSDYEGVGYNKNYIVLTSNQYSFSSSPQFEGSKIRVFSSNELYSFSKTLNYTDLWDIKYNLEVSDTMRAFGIRPSRDYSSDSNFYLITTSFIDGSDNVALYSLLKQNDQFSLVSNLVNTLPIFSPENPKQLGGNRIKLDGGNYFFRNEPFVFNNNLYAVHPIKYGTGSAIHFLEIDLTSKLVNKEFLLGNDNEFNFYPALAVTQKGTPIITFSNSSESKYISSAVATVNNGTASISYLNKGEGNYEKTRNTGKNRWGDYMGAWLDPVDNELVWVISQYAKPNNEWGNTIASIRGEAFNSPYISVNENSISSDLIELDIKDTLDIKITNLGNQSLIINSIQNSNSQFKIINNSLPINISLLDTFNLSVEFNPTDYNNTIDSLVIYNNSNNSSEINIGLIGNVLSPVKKGALYASSGNASGFKGILFNIDTLTYETKEIGNSNYSPLKSLTINPLTNHLFAIEATPFQQTKLLKLNTSDANTIFVSQIDKKMDAITFLDDGTLLGFGTDNTLNRIDIETGESTIIYDIGFRVNTCAVRPSSNSILVNRIDLNDPDRFYDINILSGKVTFVGKAGVNNSVLAITFNSQNNLLATFGASNEFSKLALINLDENRSEILATLSAKFVVGLAFAKDGIVGISESKEQPISKFELEQNYPNPFNPSTVIKYRIASSAQGIYSRVQLIIYDILGRKIATLVDKNQSSGEYSVKFDATMIKPNISSGTYIYQLKIGDTVISRKMIYLK